jgi:hypothetical protein
MIGMYATTAILAALAHRTAQEKIATSSNPVKGILRLNMCVHAWYSYF